MGIQHAYHQQLLLKSFKIALLDNKMFQYLYSKVNLHE